MNLSASRSRAGRLGLRRPEPATAVDSEAPPVAVTAAVRTPEYVLVWPWWPKAAQPAGLPALVVPVVVGSVAAIMVPSTDPGLGWLVTAVAAALGVHWAAGRERELRLGWAGLSLALMVVPVVRAAAWLDALCLLTACLAGTLAITGGRGLRALLFGTVAVPLAGFRSLPWVSRGVLALRGRGAAGGARLVGTVVVGVVLLLVFGSLFAGADAAFGRLVSDSLSFVDTGSATFAITVFVVVGLGAAGACYLLAAPPDLSGRAVAGRLRRVEWALPVGLLVGLFAVFVGLQAVELFGGSGYVLRTAGLTYAEYARTGFWQLAAVTVLTLLVIGGTVRLAPRERDRTWLRVLLGGLAALTVVIVVSALLRMWSYQQAYGFTVLRLLVESCEFWLGLVYLMVLASGIRMRVGWVPRAAVATGMAALLVLASVNPEGFIAQRNIDRWHSTGRIDANYLSGLSPDAVGQIATLPEPVRDCVLWTIAERQSTVDWRSWNAGRALNPLQLANLHCASERPVAPVSCG